MPRWTEGLILERIRRWTRITGKPPTADAWRGSVQLGDVRYPSAGSVASHCGGFREALVLAGVVDPTSLPRKLGSGELTVRRKQANDYWYGKWSVDGHRIVRSLGRKTGRDSISRLDAERRLAAAMGRAKPDADPVVERAYGHLRRAMQEADRLRLDGEARRAVDAAVTAMHTAEDAFVRALGLC